MAKYKILFEGALEDEVFETERRRICTVFA